MLRAGAFLTMAIVALYLPVEAVLLPTYFTEQDQPERLGTVLMALSIGGLAGSLAYGRWGLRWSKRNLYVTAMVAVGVPILGMSLLPPFPVLVVLAAIAGFCYGPIPPLTNYAMQTRTPEALRGRVVGVLTSVEFAAGPLGYLAAGPLVEWLGLGTTFVTLGVALVVVTLFAIPARGLRLLDEPPRYAAVDDEPDPVPLGEHSVPRTGYDNGPWTTPTSSPGSTPSSTKSTSSKNPTSAKA